MEEQPAFEDSQDETHVTRRADILDFVQKMGRVLMVCGVGSVFYALVVGPQSVIGFTNGLFIAGVILLIVALLPLGSEVVGRATLVYRMEDQSLSEALDEEMGRRQRGETITYLCGISGIIVVVLSFVISTFGK